MLTHVLFSFDRMSSFRCVNEYGIRTIKCNFGLKDFYQNPVLEIQVFSHMG